MPVQMRTILEVADNSGAKRLACILPLGGSTGLKASLGDIITASVKEASPDSNVKKGSVVKCVIVRTRKETRRKDGTYIRFDTNAAVLINDDHEPIGTRVFGPVARELRDKKFMKIVSLRRSTFPMSRSFAKTASNIPALQTRFWRMDGARVRARSAEIPSSSGVDAK